MKLICIKKHLLLNVGDLYEGDYDIDSDFEGVYFVRIKDGELSHNIVRFEKCYFAYVAEWREIQINNLLK